MKRTVIGCMMAFCTMQAVEAGGVLEKISARQQYAYQFASTSPSLQMAALRYFSEEPSLSGLSIGFHSSPSSADRLPQQGDGGRAWQVEATSFYRLGSYDCVWGEASYINGRRYNVRWCETSDFELVYPYVMADDRGGDLHYEQYMLHGGYSRRWHHLLYGFTLGYRALSEYRQRDPRPNNTVADLAGSLSFGYSWERYAAALSFEAGKYKQTNELVYFNDLGAQKEYHLTGIGNDFARFSGNNNTTFFKGHRLGGTIGLSPLRAIGLYASLRYQHLHLDKVITNLNRLVLNEINEDQWSAQGSWQHRRWGARLSGTYTRRRGKDNLFGDPSGNVYPQIGSRDMYDAKHYRVMLSGYYEAILSQRFNVGISPATGLSGFESKHTDSGNQFNAHQWHYGLTLYGEWHTKKDRVVLTTMMDGRQETNGTLRLNETSTIELENMLNGIRDYLHQGETHFGASIEYDHAIQETWGLVVKGGWQHAAYGGNHANLYEVSVGVSM